MRANILSCVLALAAVPALASDARVDWPTFLRAGPSAQYTVIDELLRGTRLDVRSCDGAWCQVQYDRAVGYVKRAALNATDFPPGAGPSGSGCFESRRAGYGKGEVFRYCGR